MKTRTYFIMSIGGGINLESEHFTVRKTRSSKQLDHMKKLFEQSEEDFAKMPESDKWLRSEIGKPQPAVEKLSQPQWKAKPKVTRTDGQYQEHQASETHKVYQKIGNDGSWQEMHLTGNQAIEKFFNPITQELHIREITGGKIQHAIIGKFSAPNRITFSPEVLPETPSSTSPKKKPAWWAIA